MVKANDVVKNDPKHPVNSTERWKVIKYDLKVAEDVWTAYL